MHVALIKSYAVNLDFILCTKIIWDRDCIGKMALWILHHITSWLKLPTRKGHAPFAFWVAGFPFFNNNNLELGTSGPVEFGRLLPHLGFHWFIRNTPLMFYTRSLKEFCCINILQRENMGVRKGLIACILELVILKEWKKCGLKGRSSVLQLSPVWCKQFNDASELNWAYE